MEHIPKHTFYTLLIVTNYLMNIGKWSFKRHFHRHEAADHKKRVKLKPYSLTGAASYPKSVITVPFIARKSV